MQLIKLILKKAPASGSGASTIVGEYVFDGSLFTIGSDGGNTIVIGESAPEQAVLIQEGDVLTLINGAEGTSVNGRLLKREAMEPLTMGDEIRIGEHIIAVRGSTATRVIGRNGTANPPAPPPVAMPRSALDEIETPGKAPARNFAEVLNTLRTEEDSFYFIVDDGREERRIPLEQSETSLGLTANGEIGTEPDLITSLQATVRKEWGAIIVEPQSSTIFVNNEKIAEPHHLRNGDRLSFSPARKSGKPPLYLELHEPTSLIALESILETRPRNRTSNGTETAAANAGDSQKPVPISDRRFFGHFSFLEIFTMAIGTLIAAVLIFIVLELTAG